MNLVVLMGRLGGDPETSTVGETTVTKVSLATDESYRKKDGEKVNEVEWHDLEIWGKQGETLAEYTQKGCRLLVVGKVKTNKWQTDDGDTRSKKLITVQRFEFIDGKNTSDSTPDKKNEGTKEDDDLPF